MKATTLPILFLFFLIGFSNQIHAQATLSFQGILKKSNGIAVDDDTYSLTFSLYNAETGGSPLWTETQTDVEVSSGIYSVLLGDANPIKIAFDEIYYLGVKVNGGSELTPRFRLTSAPYALSLIGESNIFPSSGDIKADGAIIANKMVVGGAALAATHALKVVGGVLANSGAPGGNTGYAFDGDFDTGIFSKGDGQVSVYTNNNEKLTITNSKTTVAGDQEVSGTLSAGNVNMKQGGSINYNGLKDWRLVETDYFENNDTDGWRVSLPISGDDGAWRNGILNTVQVKDFGEFAGKALGPSDNDHVLKKQYSLNNAGDYTQIKVVFNYFMLNEWRQDDWANNGWAAFSTTSTGSKIRVGWMRNETNMSLSYVLRNDNTFKSAANFENGRPGTTIADQWVRGEMVGHYSGKNFWVFFGYTNNDAGLQENFAVGSIEIWVR